MAIRAAGPLGSSVPESLWSCSRSSIARKMSRVAAHPTQTPGALEGLRRQTNLSGLLTPKMEVHLRSAQSVALFSLKLIEMNRKKKASKITPMMKLFAI